LIDELNCQKFVALNIFAVLDEQQATIGNIVGAMSGIAGEKRALIINRQLCYFFRADISLGVGVAMGLGINLESQMVQHAMSGN
jgi:catalase